MITFRPGQKYRGLPGATYPAYIRRAIDEHNRQVERQRRAVTHS